MHSYYRLELSFQKFFSTQCLEILIWEKSLIDCKLAIVSFVFSGLQIDLSIIFSFHLMFRSLDVPFSGAVHVAALPYRFSETKRSRVLVAQCWRLTSNFYEVTHEVTSWTDTGWFVNGCSLMSTRCPPSPKNKITKRWFRHCSQEDWSFHHLKSLLPEHTQQTQTATGRLSSIKDAVPKGSMEWGLNLYISDASNYTDCKEIIGCWH